jgi:hypothetical protein
MAHFPSVFMNENGYWKYSGHSVYRQFLVLYRFFFSQHCGTMVENFLNTASAATSSYRQVYWTPDIVISCQQIERSELRINLFS